MAGAQRDDLGRGAAGDPADQGHRLPLPERQGVRRARRGGRPRGDAVHLAAVHDRQRRVRTLGERGLARRAAPRLRSVPHVGPHAGHRGSDDRARPRHAGVAPRTDRIVDGGGDGALRPCRDRGAPDSAGRIGDGWARRQQGLRAGGPASVRVRRAGAHRPRRPPRPPPRPRRGGADIPLRQQARRAGAHPRRAQQRHRDRRRGRERTQRGCVPARLPTDGTDDGVHTDAAVEPRRELPGEQSLLRSRRRRVERARPADAPRLRQALRPWRVRPWDAREHRLRRALPLRHRPRDARRGEQGARRGQRAETAAGTKAAGCTSTTPPRSASRAPGTTT